MVSAQAYAAHVGAHGHGDTEVAVRHVDGGRELTRAHALAVEDVRGAGRAAAENAPACATLARMTILVRSVWPGPDYHDYRLPIPSSFPPLEGRGREGPSQARLHRVLDSFGQQPTPTSQ